MARAPLQGSCQEGDSVPVAEVFDPADLGKTFGTEISPALGGYLRGSRSEKSDLQRRGAGNSDVVFLGRRQDVLRGGLVEKGPNSTTLALHADNSLPSPLPPHAIGCQTTYWLSDYTRENGSTAVVPGSHKWCRQPLGDEKIVPEKEGDRGNQQSIPLEGKAGSLLVPIQSFLTLYLQRRHLDARVRPCPWVTWMVALIFLAQTALSVMIVRNLLVYL